MKIQSVIPALVVVLFVAVPWAGGQHEMMIRGGALYVAMGDDLDASNLDGARSKAAELVDVSREIQLFWTLQNQTWQVDDGVEWATDVHKKAVELVKTLDAGDVDATDEARQATGQACVACHQKYRPPRRSP